MSSEDLREQLAELCHNQWVGWMNYLEPRVDEEDDWERWQRQMATDYKDLPEHEKESDRAEADKFLNLLRMAGVLK